MEILKPDFGLVFWMLISFLVVLFLLKKYAWKPIIKMINDREEKILKAIKIAEEAKKEVQKNNESKTKIIEEANIEKNKIIKQTRKEQEQIISKTKEKAEKEAEKIILKTKQHLKSEKQKALNDIKNDIIKLSVSISEKIMQKELETSTIHKKIIEENIAELNLSQKYYEKK